MAKTIRYPNRGCIAFWFWAIAGLGPGVVFAEGAAPDPEILKAQKQCDAGDAESCYGVGILLYAGEGIPKNPPLAARYLRRACEAGFGAACFFLGQMHALGEGVAKDRARAVALFDLACTLAEPKGCQVLEQMKKMSSRSASMEETRETAIVLIERRCGNKTQTAKEAEDCKRVRDSFRRGCDGGNASSCAALKRIEAVLRLTGK